MFHQLDINDLESITTAAAYFKEKYGGVDVLINNAGIAFKGGITVIHHIYYTGPMRTPVCIILNTGTQLAPAASIFSLIPILSFK